MWVSRAMYLMPDASLCLVQLLPAQGGRRLAACVYPKLFDTFDHVSNHIPINPIYLRTPAGEALEFFNASDWNSYCINSLLFEITLRTNLCM